MFAKYVSVWDDGTIIRTRCEWDDNLLAAYDVESVDVECGGVLVREYVEVEEEEYDVFSDREFMEYIPSADTEWPDEWLDDWENEWKRYGDDMTCPDCGSSAFKTVDFVSSCYDCHWTRENRVAK